MLTVIPVPPSDRRFNRRMAHEQAMVMVEVTGGLGEAKEAALDNAVGNPDGESYWLEVFEFLCGAGQA